MPTAVSCTQKLTNTQSIWPRTAAWNRSLWQSAGVYEGKEIEMGLKFLASTCLARRDFSSRSILLLRPLYAVQAMWHAGGKTGGAWYPAIRDELMIRQTHDGSWPDITVNGEYGTAMACIVLQMPNNYCRSFQR